MDDERVENAGNDVAYSRIQHGILQRENEALRLAAVEHHRCTRVENDIRAACRGYAHVVHHVGGAIEYRIS